MDIEWIAIFPYYLAYPGLKSPVEIMAVVSAAVSLFGFTLTLLMYLKKYISYLRAVDGYFAATQSMWIIRVIFTIIQYYCRVSAYASSILTSIWCVTDICTYMSALISVHLIVQIMNWTEDKPKITIIVGIITFLNIFLAGPNYLYFVYYFPTTNALFGYFYDYYSDFFYYSWEILVFALDLVPPILLLGKISLVMTKKMDRAKFNDFQKCKSYIYILLVVDLINLVGFVVGMLVQYCTLVVGSDIAFYCLWIIQLLNYLVHSTVLLLLYELMTFMMKLRTVRGSTDRKQKDNNQIVDSISPLKDAKTLQGSF
ncbi:hypothetical protein HDV04_003666 [Boothiomyces sp. JEL0838]|nr:hypothetical protein HDV04_003666 [Boothiomyces sp. JEL0838]